MEIPKHIQNLYRHLEYHTAPQRNTLQKEDVFVDTKLFTEIEWFIHERIIIWKKKTNKEKPPYTANKVLSTYRFCNILRELDKQTIDFHTLLNPLRDDFALWLLNMFYCRMIARPETVESVGLLSFNEKENNKLFERLSNSPRPRYGTPYVFPVSTIMRSETPTRELFLTKYLPTVMKKVAKEIETWHKESMYDGVEKILPLFGFNHNFLWTEVLIDVAYQYPEYIDLFARFPVGPGSLPSMRRINSKVDPSLLAQELSKLNITTDLTVKNKPIYLSAENWEGVGCEFRKFTNLTEGRGRKRKYTNVSKAYIFL